MVAVLAWAAFAGRAGAAPVGPTLVVSLAVDPAALVVDHSPGLEPAQYTLAYTIRVENTTTDPAAAPAEGVEVVDVLPAGLVPAAPFPAHSTVTGNEVRIDVVGLGFGAWQDVVHARVVSTEAGQLPFSNQAVVTSADGTHIVSTPAVTKVTVISAVTIERAPAVAYAPATAVASSGATRVLATTVVRDEVVAAADAVADTGIPVEQSVGVGLGLVLAGWTLVSTARGRG